MKVEKVLETCLYVDDLARAERFYTEVLGLVFVSRQEGRHVFFRCGQGMLLLFNPLGCGPAGNGQTTSAAGIDVPPHGALGPGHVAFAVSQADLPAWSDHLSHHHIAIEKVIDWPGG